VPPRKRAKSRSDADRVRHLIAVDAATVMSRLGKRHAEMVRLFSRLRDRSPLLEVVQSWFQSITFGELACLEPREQRAITAFYEHLADLRWYLQYTEDMPLQVGTHVTQFVRELAAAHRALTEQIGPPDAEAAEVIEVRVVKKKGHAASS
jgi:hypothetical protein